MDVIFTTRTARRLELVACGRSAAPDLSGDAGASFETDVGTSP
jgi:hypothetical protein